MKLALTAVPADGFYPWCTGLEGGVGPVSRDPLLRGGVNVFTRWRAVVRAIGQHHAVSTEIINRN
jgi:hypothetical protein